MDLIAGMSDYIVLQTKSSKTDTVNYSPPSSVTKKRARRSGWKMITKGILNTSAPQHQIFQDNLKRVNPVTDTYYNAFRLNQPEPSKPSRFKNSEQFLERNKENAKIVGLFTRAQRRIEDLDESKKSFLRHYRKEEGR